MGIKDVFLFGIGQYADPIIELCLDCNYKIKGLYHYNSDRNGHNLISLIHPTAHVSKSAVLGESSRFKFLQDPKIYEFDNIIQYEKHEGIRAIIIFIQ